MVSVVVLKVTHSRAINSVVTGQTGEVSELVYVVSVVVLKVTHSRAINSVVTGQALVTLEWRNTPEKKDGTKPIVV